MSLSDVGSWASIIGLALTGLTVWLAWQIRSQVIRVLLARKVEELLRQTELAIESARRQELENLRERLRDLASGWTELLELVNRQKSNDRIGTLYDDIRPKAEVVRKTLEEISLLQSPQSLRVQVVIQNLESTHSVISRLNSKLKEHGK